MSKPQGLDAIGPMQDQSQKPVKDEKPKDPVTAEFEEGKKFLANGNPAQAAIAFHNVLLAYEEKKDENGIANASNQLGHVCLERGDFEKAEAHYKRAWDIVEKADDPMSMNLINKKLIEVYRGLKEYKKSINICLDLLDEYRLNNNAPGTVELLEDMAEIFVESGDNAAAADAYKTIASIHKNYRHDKMAETFEKKAAELA